MVHGTMRIVGREESVLIEIPLEEVVKIEARRFSRAKTTLLVLGLAFAVLGAVGHNISFAEYNEIFRQ